MSVYLLDVNVLVALIWSAHESHSRVQAWFRTNQKAGWATCPFTQTAFVRIVSNPAFSRDAVTPQEAEELLSANLGHSTHRFWPADLEYGSAISSFAHGIVGHRQVSDGYLLGLAIHHRGKLATLDQGIRAILPSGSKSHETIIEV